MADICETELCIVCNDPASYRHDKLKYRFPSKKRSKSVRLKQKKNVESCPGDPSEDNETDVLLLPQLRVVFLLKHIFNQSWHNHDVIETMRTLGDPSDWFEICQRCIQVVDEGVEVIRKLKFFEEKRKRIVSILKGKYVKSIKRSNYGNHNVGAQDETLEFLKEKLDFRNIVREVPVDIKLEVDHEMLEHPDDWMSNGDDDNLEFPTDFDESQPSPSQIKISEESVKMKMVPLDIKDVPHDYVKKIKRVWSKYKEDPDFVYNSPNETKTRRKYRKSSRGLSLGQSTFETDNNVTGEEQQEDPIELTDSNNVAVALPENPEVAEEETLEILKKNGKLRQKILKAKSEHWIRKRNENKIKTALLKRAKAALQKPSRLAGTKYDKDKAILKGRPPSEAVRAFLKRAHELLDMNLVPYPPKTAAERAKIPKRKMLEIKRLKEEGLYSQKTNFPCPPCRIYFGNKFYAIAHIHRVHFGIKKPWRCNQCSKVYSNYKRMQEHLECHTKGELTACPICKYSCKPEKMGDHVLDHEKGKDVRKCHVCSKTFSEVNKFVKHMNEHGFFPSKSKKSNKYVCELCNESYKNNKQLDYHKIKVHNEVDQEGRFPICAECSEVLFNNKMLERHSVRIHGRGSMDYFCEHCGKGFFLELDLKTHVLYCGDNEGKICKICGHRSKNQRMMKRHIVMRHPETVNMSEEEISEYVKKRKEETPFQCKLCLQSFAFNNLLFWHHRKDHPEITDKFKCSECGKGFSRQCSVKRHYENRHLKLEYKCDSCGKAFPKDGLKQHQRFHCKVKQQARSERCNDNDRPNSITSLPQEQPQQVIVETSDVKHDGTNSADFEHFFVPCNEVDVIQN